MRFRLFSLCALLVPFVAGPASHSALAESRIFIVSNQPDGYGVDLCLARGERCGQPIARSYCQSKQFASATAFRKVKADDVTGAIPRQDATCPGNGCGEYVAITCER